VPCGEDRELAVLDVARELSEIGRTHTLETQHVAAERGLVEQREAVTAAGPAETGIGRRELRARDRFDSNAEGTIGLSDRDRALDELAPARLVGGGRRYSVRRGRLCGASGEEPQRSPAHRERPAGSRPCAGGDQRQGWTSSSSVDCCAPGPAVAANANAPNV